MEKIINKIKCLKVPAYIYFIIAFTILIFAYDIHNSSFERPRGLHTWRQCVGASYAMNYYNYDLNPTELHIYNYLSKEATSDGTIAEFPILYYFVAVFYKLFGNNDAIFRIINLLILFIGLFYLMKSANKFLHDTFYSIFLPVLLYTSATLVYYSNSFLPDTTALGVIFVAIYQVIRYSETRKIKHIYYASLLYTVAGLLKITSMVSFGAITGAFVLLWIFSKSFRKEFKIVQFIIPVLLPLIIIISWYAFIHIYHSIYGGAITRTTISSAYWLVSAEEIAKTWKRIWDEWIYTYFRPSTLITAGIALVFLTIQIKKSNAFLMTALYITLLGGFVVFFSFFKSLFNHDYYLINTFFLVIFILFMSFLYLKNHVPKLYNSAFTKLFLVLVIIVYIPFVNKAVDRKYNDYWYNYSYRVKDYGLADIEPVSRSMGITAQDKVISIPDFSNNISLYYMNQPGWNDFGFNNKKGSERIDFFISKGAKYLFVSDTSIYKKEEYAYLQKYTTDTLFTHRNIEVFDLRKFGK